MMRVSVICPAAWKRPNPPTCTRMSRTLPFCVRWPNNPATMNRRQFLKACAIAGCGIQTVAHCLGESPEAALPEKLILSAPLTDSDWVLKAGIAWGEPGVRHMVDACKACGWSRIYWRALDGG